MATWNALRVGRQIDGVEGGGKLPDVHGLVVEEGEDEGVNVREELGVPGDIGARRSHFHSEEKRKGWEFQEGRVYFADFGNGYLDFNGLLSPLFLVLLLIMSSCCFYIWPPIGANGTLI